jgi:hypothetical protein
MLACLPSTMTTTTTTTTTNSSDDTLVLCDASAAAVGSSSPSSSWEDSFADNVQHLWCSSRRRVDILDQPPTPLEFSRDYISASRPCIIRKAILVDSAAGGPTTTTTTKQAMEQQKQDALPQQQDQPLYLTLDDIMERLDPDATQLMVDVTPDGHGDCVRRVMRKNTTAVNHKTNADESSSPSSQLLFVQPKECPMSLQDFRDRLRRQQQVRAAARTSTTTSAAADRSNCQDINGLPAIPISSDSTTSTGEKSSTNDTSGLLPDDSIVYYSRQNDCLRTPEENEGSSPSNITELASLFPSGLEWAQQAFGTSLEAVNLWIGNECSVSSMHKDHYENLFYVASGEKLFTVCPPADVPFLYQHVEYPSGQFEFQCEQQGEESSSSSFPSWGVRPVSSTTTTSDNKVRWIYPDVSQLLNTTTRREEKSKNDLLQEFPLLCHTHPMEIRVQAGELLYLPSLWFHRVTQSCETIGVNYWYDMKFEGGLWCYFELLQELRVVPLSSLVGGRGEEVANGTTTGGVKKEKEES